MSIKEEQDPFILSASCETYIKNYTFIQNFIPNIWSIEIIIKMVKYCALRNCKNNWEPFSQAEYHSFPDENKELFGKWIGNIPNNLLPNWIKNAYICSKHFEKSCYEVDCNVRKILKKDAVPTIFEDSYEDDINISLNDTDLSLSQQSVNSDQHSIDSTNVVKCINYQDMPDFKKKRKVNAGVQVKSRYLPASPIKTKLKKDIKVLQQRLKRKDEALTALKLLLVQLKMYKGIK